jgi:hypothetical protein
MDTPTIEVLQQNVKLRLVHLNKTITELADEHKLDRKKVSAWIRYGNPRLTTIELIAKLMSVPVWALLDPEFNPKEWSDDDE